MSEHILAGRLCLNDSYCKRANPTCHHKLECQGVTRRPLFETGFDHVLLQQLHAQVSLRYLLLLAGLYLISTYFIQKFLQQCMQIN